MPTAAHMLGCLVTLLQLLGPESILKYIPEKLALIFAQLPSITFLSQILRFSYVNIYWSHQFFQTMFVTIVTTVTFVTIVTTVTSVTYVTLVTFATIVLSG